MKGGQSGTPERLAQPRTPEEEAEYWLDHREVDRAPIIRGLDSIDAVQAFVAFENRHQQRREVLDALATRAEELRA